MAADAPDRAAEAAAAAAKLSGRNPGNALLDGLARHADGLARSDPARLRSAVELLDGAEWPLATAAAREDLARMLTSPGDTREAIAEMETAYAAYSDACAPRDAARVRGALRALGVRKRQPAVAGPSHGWASLTAAELAVVEAVAEGRTNREAAAQLYLSPDTVNTHLRHAFTKLGIRSRVELASLVVSRRHGTEPGAGEKKKVT